MAYELNGKKNICIFEDVLTLQIILKNEIPGSNLLLKVTSTVMLRLNAPLLLNTPLE